MSGGSRGGQIMSALSQDFGFAIRAWRRSPGFAATVIGSIALAIAINATVFSLANAVLFRPLSVHQPGALANVYATVRGSGSSTRFRSGPVGIGRRGAPGGTARRCYYQITKEGRRAMAEAAHRFVSLGDAVSPAPAPKNT